MRDAVRQLGWKVTKIGMIGTRHGTVIVVRDVREVPKEHPAVIGGAMNDRMRARLHKVWGEPGPAPAQRGSVALMTQEFRCPWPRAAPEAVPEPERPERRARDSAASSRLAGGALAGLFVLVRPV